MTDEDDLAPSKSQRKREMQAQFELGKVLVDLPANQIKKLSLDETLRDAIETCKNIRQHGAHKRQLKLIGKLLKSADIPTIQQAIADFKAPQREAVAQLHAIEDWRDKLLEDDDAALTAFIRQHPLADRQQLRHIIRNSKQTKSPQRSTRAKRELFQFIRELIEMSQD